MRERLFNADIIARAKLKGTKASAEAVATRDDGSTLYQGVVQFTFEVFEYLMGSGGSELAAVATVYLGSDAIRYILDSNAKGEFWQWRFVDDENPYTSMDLALEAAKKWEKERVTTWDDREAIIMVGEQHVPGASDGSKRFWLGPLYAYAVDSMHRVWLPSDADYAVEEQSGSETRYLLTLANRVSLSGGSEGLAKPEVKTLSEMKALIAELEQWRRGGEGIEGYEECIRESFEEEKFFNGYRERGFSTYILFDHTIESGLSEESVIRRRSSIPSKVWLYGDDKELFEIAPYDIGLIRTNRPLPAGEYSVFENIQPSRYIPCGYLPENAQNTIEHVVRVTAPIGALHEAFFDLAAAGTDATNGSQASSSMAIGAWTTSAVVAEGVNGLIEPASFAIDDTTTTTLDSIAWESPRATIESSPAALPANHHVDFIALDGTVALRLDVDDATKSVDGDDTTFTWGVCAQPWKAGDQLMLRISKSPADLTGATNDLACDGTPIRTLP